MFNLLFMASFAPMPLLGLIWPIAGLAIWMWLSLSNFHRELHGAAEQWPYVSIMAVATILGWIASAGQGQRRFASAMIMLVGLALVILTSGLTSLAPSVTWPLVDRNLKTLLLIVLVYLIVDDRMRLEGMLFVWIFSIGYWALKGGLLFLASGGSHQFAGPEGTMIGDRNHLAVAMVMMLPFLIYLLTALELPRLGRLAVLGAIACSVLAIVGTFSRGGFLSLLVVGTLLLIQSKRLLTGLLVVGVLGIVLAGMVPQEWLDRMGGIQTAADSDNSFRDRMFTWLVYLNAGLDRPLTGVGLGALQVPTVHELYAPTEAVFGLFTDQVLAAHSIYFQLIGEVGILGSVVYGGLVASIFINAGRARRYARGVPELAWVIKLARALRTATLAFLVGGAALSLAFYDGFLLFVAFAAVLPEIAQRDLLRIRGRPGVRTQAPAAGRDQPKTAWPGLPRPAYATRHLPGRSVVPPGGDDRR